MDGNDQSLLASEAEVRQRRLDLAQKAFREFYAQCFWSYRQDAEITEDKIPFVIRGLREHGGLAGYKSPLLYARRRGTPNFPPWPPTLRFNAKWIASM